MQATNRIISPQIRALKVLVVGDEPYMRKVPRTILAAIGVHNILEAADGVTGLQMGAINRPDLIIVDWVIPMMDGPQFVQMVLTPYKFPVPDTPIIILSAHSDQWRGGGAARGGAGEV